MEPEHESSERRYLATYLRDHRAGAEAGVRLARRCCDHAPDAATGDELRRIADEIDEDRVALAAIMDRLGVEPSAVKRVASVAAERIARLKLNGRLVRTSPLSVVVELEGLVGAVTVKRQLWVSLSASATGADTPAHRLADLVARAEDQRTRLEAIHRRLVQSVFGAAASLPGDPVAAVAGGDQPT